ncbi:hypothetical protein [Ureibacillus chungkukjangi]|uniref:Uncharacterized protein n=1 Tax=Ureibacillus chungkukjangi TaxID=1202712 RepID=A0A318TNK4_9BACL|nr:hypothetical protein [Ureibacillus chungkukjangi]MCM3389587.1 hypothetical protein [Ureibacillus chungkukjangi]PYF06346.1 hypothetical protein BJ095_11048 [Ureibacillus chungkukjangi]
MKSRNKRHFFICLFISVLFTISLIRTYSNTGELPIGSIIFTAAVYIATILSAFTLKEKPKKK